MSSQRRVSFSKIEFPAGERARTDDPAMDARNASPFRKAKQFCGGFILVILCAGIAWPLLPRRYESTASVILRPTDVYGRMDSVQSLGHPLDDNAIQSEMDIIGSPTIASAVIAHHNLANDPEVAGDPSRLSRRFLEGLYRVAPIMSEWFGDLRQVSDAGLREQLQKHLSVSRDRRSYTVKMGYWSSDPAKAAANVGAPSSTRLGWSSESKACAADTRTPNARRASSRWPPIVRILPHSTRLNPNEVP
jgi:hypothetical protein